MPVGTIARVVHYTGQASRLENVAAVASRNSVGYGYVAAAGELLYFDPGGVQADFDSLQAGQHVEFERDPSFAVATAVRPISRDEYARQSGDSAGREIEPADRPAPDLTKQPQAAAAPVAGVAPATARPAPPKKKAGEEAATLLVENPRQCIVAMRYKQMSPGRWQRARREPEIETYTTDVADDYREPQLMMVSDIFCVVRVYDERAVNFKRLTDFLGEYSAAEARCDAALREKFPEAQIAEDP